MFLGALPPNPRLVSLFRLREVLRADDDLTTVMKPTSDLTNNGGRTNNGELTTEVEPAIVINQSGDLTNRAIQLTIVITQMMTRKS
jgi:hypothetical protein